MKKLLKIMRFFKTNLMRIVNIFKIYRIVLAKTYYPEIKRKNLLRRFGDNFLWTIKYGEINSFYNLYGFDIKSAKRTNDYINYLEFMRDRNRLNKLDDTYSYVALLRDKILFEKYLKSNNVNTANNLAIIMNGEVYSKEFEKITDLSPIFQDTVFIKSVNGECADGVYCIKNLKDFKEHQSNFTKGIFIIQEKIIQHEKMDKLNAKAVNTIRIVTVRKGDNIEVLCSGLRIGTSISNFVDNWAAGGVFVEIDKSGKLTKYGFYKPKYNGGKTEIHPDSKIKFLNYQIPKYDEVIKLVKRAHSTLYGIHSIGWDVAISQDGPILIEGNDNWEISFMQVNNGLKKEWKACLK